jgi:hypothetical protein
MDKEKAIQFEVECTPNGAAVSYVMLKKIYEIIQKISEDAAKKISPGVTTLTASNRELVQIGTVNGIEIVGEFLKKTIDDLARQIIDYQEKERNAESAEKNAANIEPQEDGVTP